MRFREWFKQFGPAAFALCMMFSAVSTINGAPWSN